MIPLGALQERIPPTTFEEQTKLRTHKKPRNSIKVLNASGDVVCTLGKWLDNPVAAAVDAAAGAAAAAQPAAAATHGRAQPAQTAASSAACVQTRATAAAAAAPAAASAPAAAPAAPAAAEQPLGSPGPGEAATGAYAEGRAAPRGVHTLVAGAPSADLLAAVSVAPPDVPWQPPPNEAAILAELDPS